VQASSQLLFFVRNLWWCTSAELIRNFEVANKKRLCVLQLTNDRPNCSGLLLLSTFSVSWACYISPIGMSHLSVRWKTTGNVF